MRGPTVQRRGQKGPRKTQMMAWRNVKEEVYIDGFLEKEAKEVFGNLGRQTLPLSFQVIYESDSKRV